jgi:hypothetical protein
MVNTLRTNRQNGMDRLLTSKLISSFLGGCLLLYPCPLPISAQDAAQSGAKQPADKPEASTLPQPPAFALEDGTPVKLRLNNDLSSASAVTGQTVDFAVVEAVRTHDVVVIPEGGIAWATVTEAQHKRHLGRGGKLNLVIDRVRLADGERAPLRAVKEAQGGGHVGAMTTAMVATGILIFPVAPLFLFMHGKDITIPKGTEVTAYVNGDYALDRAKFVAIESGKLSANAAPARAPEPPKETVVEVNSYPPGADIILNGKLVGNTPSTLRLAAGDYKIRIRKHGYQTWDKALKVDGTGTQAITVQLQE